MTPSEGKISNAQPLHFFFTIRFHMQDKTADLKTFIVSISYKNFERFRESLEKSFEKKYVFLLYSAALGALFNIVYFCRL